MRWVNKFPTKRWTFLKFEIEWEICLLKVSLALGVVGGAQAETTQENWWLLK